MKKKVKKQTRVEKQPKPLKKMGRDLEDDDEDVDLDEEPEEPLLNEDIEDLQVNEDKDEY